VPLSQNTVTRLPDNLDRTFQLLYVSKCSTIIFVSIDPTTRSGHHLRFPACFNTYATISAGCVATSHKAMDSPQLWQHRLL
jgi:hypothetical protein